MKIFHGIVSYILTKKESLAKTTLIITALHLLCYVLLLHRTYAEQFVYYHYSAERNRVVVK